jgi:hypothetical protein
MATKGLAILNEIATADRHFEHSAGQRGEDMRLISRLSVLAVLALTSCAPVYSRYQPSQNEYSDSANQGGLVYYLPKKNIIVTLVFEKDVKVPKASVALTEAFPDLSQRFVAYSSRSWIGDDNVTIKTTSTGLLTSTNADFVSQVPEIFNELARLAGYASVAKTEDRKGAPEPTCEGPGTYVRVLDPASRADRATALCGLDIRITSYFELDSNAGVQNVATGSATISKATPIKPEGEYNGLFYRRPTPYLVTVGPPQNPLAAAMVASPSGGAIERLPARYAFFADSNANFEFVDGMPTAYGQKTGSEVRAFVGIPAGMIKAYFEAIGAAWSSKTTIAQSETSYLAQIQALALQQEKTARCLEAIRSKSPDQEALCK